jgi:hypothetical protein
MPASIEETTAPYHLSRIFCMGGSSPLVVVPRKLIPALNDVTVLPYKQLESNACVWTVITDEFWKIMMASQVEDFYHPWVHWGTHLNHSELFIITLWETNVLLSHVPTFGHALRASSVDMPKSHANSISLRVLGWISTLALQRAFWITHLSMPSLEGSSLTVLPPFAGGTPSHCTCLHMHIINAILNIQWDQPLQYKCLSFDLLGAVAFIQRWGERQPRGCMKKNTMYGWWGCIGSTSTAKVSTNPRSLQRS